MKYTILLFLPFLLISGLKVYSQTASHVKITMEDGSELQGRILSLADSLAILEGADGDTLRILKSEASRFEFYDPVDVEDYFRPEFYPVTSSPLAPPADALYLRNVYLYYNEVVFGFTDHLSLRAGIMPFFFLNLLTVESNYNISLGEYFHAGLGPVMVFSFANFYFLATKSDFVLAAKGNMAFGNRKRNISAGFGYGLSSFGSNSVFGGGVSKLGESNFFTIAGVLPISKKLSLITDNFISDELFAGVGGLRFITTKFALDGGIIYGEEDGISFEIFPFIGATYRIK